MVVTVVVGDYTFVSVFLNLFYWAAVARWCCVDQCGGTEVVGGRTTGAKALLSPDE